MKTLSMSLFVTGLVFYLVMPCFGMGVQPQPTPAAFSSKRLAKAEVDECFNGVGNYYKEGPNCSSGERKKANQSYLWGLTKFDDTLWFGTAPNMICMVHAFASYENSEYDPQPYQGNLWTCEYEEGQYLDSEMASLNVPEKFNDYRPPKIYTYDISTSTLTEKSSAITNATAQLLLQSTFGLRSAVAYGNYVILSGPRALGSGINIFLFNGSTGAFVGATTLTDYQNIRKWLVLDDILYAAVSKESGGGAVIRYTGTTSNPFSFTEVGILDGSGAEIVSHDGRIFVGTWPDRTGDSGAIAGIYMSPEVPSGGLTASHAYSWTKVWQADDYEPDSFGATIYGTGAMASYGGYLYWGTMHVHGRAAISFVNEYNIPTSGYYDAYFNSWRATAVFRCSNFDASSPSVELLYGDSQLPVYSNGRWSYARNNMGGISGKYGSSGFGNDYNNYTWTMAVYKDQLWVGTMDHSYLWTDFENLQNIYLGGTYIYVPWWWSPDTSDYGADIWRFPSTSSSAVRFTKNGLGNYTNYGFRTVLVDDTGLYYGTANPANIAQWDDGSLKGGWELWRITGN